MKIHNYTQPTAFTPITITLESMDEALTLFHMLEQQRPDVASSLAPEPDKWCEYEMWSDLDDAMIERGDIS